MTQRIREENRGELLREQNIEAGGLKLCFSLYKSCLATEKRPAYSIAVHSAWQEDTDSAFAYDISSLKETADTIFDIICHAAVTPCTLYDVLEDLL